MEYLVIIGERESELILQRDFSDCENIRCLRKDFDVSGCINFRYIKKESIVVDY